MRCSVRICGIPAPLPAVDEIERAARGPLERHGARLRSISVRVRPSPPMHGTGRVACRVRARFANGRSLAVEEFGAAAAEAAGAAARRLVQRLDRDRVHGIASLALAPARRSID